MADVGNTSAPNGTSAEGVASTGRVLLQKWRCDVCKVRFFEAFDEACACEAECQKLLDAKKEDAASLVVQAKPETFAATLVTQDTLEAKPQSEGAGLPNSMVKTKRNSETTTTPSSLATTEKAAKTKEKTKPPSPIITPTKPPAKPSRSDSVSGSKSLSQTRIHGKKRAERKQSTAASVKRSNSHQCTANSTNNPAIPLVQAIKEAMFQQIQPMKESALTEENVGTLRDMLQKLESLDVTLEVLQTTLIGTVVSKFKKHPTLGPKAKALVTKWKAIAKMTEQKSKASEAKTKKVNHPKKQPTKPQQHSFFNPRSASAKSKSTTKSVPINPFFAPRKKTPPERVLEETRSLKRKLPAPTEKEAARLSPETTKVLAAIFQNKSTQQILAEQRKAELAANRAAERKREQERAAKRAAMFGGKKEATANSASLRPTKALLPVAPRFPVPNHVMVGEKDFHQTTLCGNDTDNDSILPENHPFRSTHKSTGPTPATATCNSWLSSPSALDTVDVKATTFTAIQRSLFDTFSILPKEGSQTQTNNYHNGQTMQLWVDSFGKMDMHGIVGCETRQVFGQLAEFIDHWRVARNESLERAAERHRKLARGKPKKAKKKSTKRQRKTYEYYEDDDWLVGDDEEEENSVPPLCLLAGPHASGKTMMVHSVAKHCGDCKVLEINTSRARSGASLKHAIEEATQSNSSLEMLQNKTNNTNSETNHFFQAAKPGGSQKKQARRALMDSDSEDEPEEKKKSSVTIILIDEVDILFEEVDAGFWTALGALARATKCPIVLTANECPPQLGSKLPCKLFWLERPSPEDCASKLWGICRNRASLLKIRPQLAARGPEAIQEQLAAIAKSCDCDLRKLLHELQVYASLASCGLAPQDWPFARPNTSPNDLPTKPTISAVSKATQSIRLEVPTVISLNPSRVPMNQHSNVVAKGSNFEMLQSANTKTQIRIGSRTISKWHVVDDATLLLQCPPYLASKEDTEWTTNPSGRWIKRVQPLLIDCYRPESTQPALQSPSRILLSDSLANGTSLHGTYCPAIEYLLADAQNATVSKSGIGDDGEAEFETETTKSNEQNECVESLPRCNSSTDEDGLEAWNAAVASASKTFPNTIHPKTKLEPSKTTPQDIAAASELDFLAQRYRDASDAALLEDFGDGLPYLSGACRGFGYDYTEDGCASYPQGGADTLKMHEKSKPPREDKLFALGWKDNCCFFGNSETYMTLPSISQRKEAKAIMNHFRGNEVAYGQLACASTNATGNASSAAVAILSEDLQPDSVVFREDLDMFVHHQEALDDSSPGDEDAYLPRGVSQLVLDLPAMLRTRSLANGKNSDSMEEESRVWNELETLRSKNLDKIVEDTTNYILPPLSSSSSWQHKSDRSRWSYGRFGLETNQTDRNCMILECLPILRRIGAVERCAEFVHEQQLAAAADNPEESLLRRSTRRVTRAAPKQRFHHYFDKVSATLRRDEADLDTSAVGAIFADQWKSGLVRPLGSRSMGRNA